MREILRKSCPHWAKPCIQFHAFGRVFDHGSRAHLWGLVLCQPISVIDGTPSFLHGTIAQVALDRRCSIVCSALFAIHGKEGPIEHGVEMDSFTVSSKLDILCQLTPKSDPPSQTGEFHPDSTSHTSSLALHVLVPGKCGGGKNSIALSFSSPRPPAHISASQA